MAARLAYIAIVALCLCGCAEKEQGAFVPAQPATSGPAVDRLRAGAAGANLLIVLLDAARPDHFGAYGYHRDTTPDVDEFCAHSIVFDRAYCQAPNTKASVASLLTSQFPDTHGVVGMFGALPAGVPTLAEVLQANGLRTVCLSANPFLSSEFGFERGFDEFVEVFREVDLEANELGRVPAELLGDGAISWLQEHREERFFAYLHFLEPHDPYDPPQPFRTKFAAGTEAEDEIALYDASLAYADSVVGQVLVEVERLGLMEETIVVFLADHGEALGEHGRFGHVDTAYQETIRIPLAIRLPAACGAEPVRRSEIISITDLMPTLLDLLHIEFPPTMQGRSRLALLAGEEEAEPSYAVSRSRGADQTGGAERPEEVIYALTGPRYTLLWGDEGRRVELYDRAADPAQQSDLAAERPEVVAELCQRFEQWAATQRARPVVLRGGRAPAPQQPTGELSDRTRDHLEALGYLK